jgi:hypothetical protein
VTEIVIACQSSLKGVIVMTNAIPNAKSMQETAANVADKAREAAGTVADKAKEFGKSAVQAADTATASVGSGVETMADKLRDHASREGMMHNAAAKVADTLERGGHYLKEEGLSGMAQDLTGLIRQHPIPALLVGVGIGYLIAHALRRGS